VPRSFLAEQPQDPLAADLDAMLAAQSRPELAVALTGERRVGQDPAEQPHELVIADRGGRAGPRQRVGVGTAGIDRGRGASSTRHTTAR
jgi:hypothetical protein